jgi:hypothetical protein
MEKRRKMYSTNLLELNHDYLSLFHTNVSRNSDTDNPLQSNVSRPEHSSEKGEMRHGL